MKFIFKLKAAFLENGHDVNEFMLLPAIIWILKLCFFHIFAIKMLLDKPYGALKLFEFKCDHFSSVFKAESQFQNSNVGGK